MIPTPYNFEPALTDAEYAKLGVLALRWSHIEHILGNCLKVILRLTDDEAVIVVFTLSADQRAEKIHQLSKLSELPAPAQKAFDELRPIPKGISTSEITSFTLSLGSMKATTSSFTFARKSDL
ncbi:hypothetical protein ACVME8_004857 [Bradyrhizobium diazoefficiens]